jgi:hypothetical protein
VRVIMSEASIISVNIVAVVEDTAIAIGLLGVVTADMKKRNSNNSSDGTNLLSRPCFQI